MADALDVHCPDCGAPPKTECYVSSASVASATHANREDAAALERGTCALCGRPMYRLNGRRWHAEGFTGCPPLPDPNTDWNAYAAKVNEGLAQGDPGDANFLPVTGLVDGHAEGTPTVCPECAAGKHSNCNGQALDPFTDEIVTCGCQTAGHDLSTVEW